MIDHIDAAAANQLDQRRRDARLGIGFVLAASMVLELYGWTDSTGADGFPEWRPANHSPGADGLDVRARVRVEDGGAVDIRAGGLNERHVLPGTFLGRLLILADQGLGQRPKPSDSNKRLAACAIASLAGMDGDQAVDTLVDHPEIAGLFFGDAA